MLIIPVGNMEVQQMLRITKISDAEVKEEMFGNFSFVPMLEKTAR